jgi:transposase
VFGAPKQLRVDRRGANGAPDGASQRDKANGEEIDQRHQWRADYEKIRKSVCPACLVGIEACASSHHWARELQAFGNTVRLMPPAYVKTLR